MYYKAESCLNIELLQQLTITLGMYRCAARLRAVSHLAHTLKSSPRIDCSLVLFAGKDGRGRDKFLLKLQLNDSSVIPSLNKIFTLYTHLLLLLIFI